MKSLLSQSSLALALAIGALPAQAGVLTFQDVVFTTSWTDNVLTLEIDAARHSGDWTRAVSLSALSLKDIGSYQSVSVSAAPAGAGNWTLSARELNANGCGGGGTAKRNSRALCLSGDAIALSDNMVFTFAFSGGSPSVDAPHLKVNFLDAAGNKTGDLLSQTITLAAAAAPQPQPQPAPAPAPTPAPAPAQPSAPEVVATPPDPALVPGSGSAPVLVDVTAPTLPATDTRSEVPEPMSIALMLGGLALMSLTRNKRK